MSEMNEFINAGSLVWRLKGTPAKWVFYSEDVHFKATPEQLTEAFAAVNKELSSTGEVGLYTFFDALQSIGAVVMDYDDYKKRRGIEPGWCMTCTDSWSDLWVEPLYFVDPQIVDEIVIVVNHHPCDVWTEC